jgi:hypothetical protein
MANSVDILNEAAQRLEKSADGLGASAGKAKTPVATVSSASEETTIKVATAVEAGNQLASSIADITATVAQSSRLATSGFNAPFWRKFGGYRPLMLVSFVSEGPKVDGGATRQPISHEIISRFRGHLFPLPPGCVRSTSVRRRAW